MHQELTDLQPRLEQMTTEIESKREMIAQVVTQRTSGLATFKQDEASITELKATVEQCQEDYEEQMASVNDKMSSKCT